MNFSEERLPARLPIRNSELGRYLSDMDCEALVTVMNVRDLADGEVLVEEGDTDSTLFFLVEGCLEVIARTDGRRRVVNTMKPGDSAGIRSFVERTPRQVRLRAKGPTTVYAIRPDDFELLLETHPRQAYSFMRGLFRMLNINLERMHRKLFKLSRPAGRR
ncbi:MAG: cyclic nucleotide-binding domain-containing protein [Sulfuritalea sp.]|nr:cyclic nucleotide-binding domain-containing protein [Sulfuritalea sp.]